MALKCLAGWPSWTRCQEVGAHFGYRWDSADPEHGKIPNLKGEDEFGRPWTNENAMRILARSGSGMVGNEWELKGWGVNKQVDLLHQFFSVVHGENPNCYVIGPNDVAWTPRDKWDGFHNIEAVANRYKQRFGHVPPFAGFGFHAYHFPGGAELPSIIYWTADEARRVYGPDIDIHITETGSLVSEQAAMDSFPLLRIGLGAGVAAWYWYVSHDEPADRYNSPSRIWHRGWGLTRVGKAFRDFVVA